MALPLVCGPGGGGEEEEALESLERTVMQAGKCRAQREGRSSGERAA